MRRILLVEDEKMIRYGIYVMIENSGIPYTEITECRNGKDAVKRLEERRYDLVLTDIKMPQMGGLELSEWICENCREEDRPLIVAISGYAEFEYVKKMMKMRAVDYLLKPVDREELKKVLWHVEKLLREMRQEMDEDDEQCRRETITGISRHKMRDAMDYILQNYEKPIDMAEVSNHISMNYSMFSSTFKEYAGENFSSFLKKLRIEKSKKLLKNTDLNIREIAGKVGFEDARRFAKVFKEETGMTPRAFREGKETERKEKK